MKLPGARWECRRLLFSFPIPSWGRSCRREVCLQPFWWWRHNTPVPLPLWIRFSIRISLYFASFGFLSTPTGVPIPAAEKQHIA
ncbi:hypothetical protein GDO78_016920 [Eleutherodactylus coqui]|uniref:Uncharacterized protein n=1 Tax=Eleutherodactylus coqui TaxID=57060 RepID=A0A8J6E7R8_ELECQ|nr:hypothetical protein GDO78_016920 [Eleutherodactylus coqui]